MENFAYSILTFNLKRLYMLQMNGDASSLGEDDVIDLSTALFKRHLISEDIFNEICFINVLYKAGKPLPNLRIQRINDFLSSM